MTADKPTNSKIKTNNKKSRNNNGKSKKSQIKSKNSQMKPTKSKLKTNNKKSTNNNGKSKKSKVKSKNSQLKPTNNNTPKKSKVKSKKSKVEPEAVYYKTKGGYYYKQTQNGGSLRVSEAEYMEGGGIFRNKSRGTRIKVDPCSDQEEKITEMEKTIKQDTRTIQLRNLEIKTLEDDIRKLQTEIKTHIADLNKLQSKENVQPQLIPKNKWTSSAYPYQRMSTLRPLPRS